MHHLLKHSSSVSSHQWHSFQIQHAYSTSVGQSRSIFKHVQRCTQKKRGRVSLCQTSVFVHQLSWPCVIVVWSQTSTSHTWADLKNCHCIDLKCLSKAVNTGWAIGHTLYVIVNCLFSSFGLLTFFEYFLTTFSLLKYKFVYEFCDRIAGLYFVALTKTGQWLFSF